MPTPKRKEKPLRKVYRFGDVRIVLSHVIAYESRLAVAWPAGTPQPHDTVVWMADSDESFVIPGDVTAELDRLMEAL